MQLKHNLDKASNRSAFLALQLSNIMKSLSTLFLLNSYKKKNWWIFPCTVIVNGRVTRCLTQHSFILHTNKISSTVSSAAGSLLKNLYRFMKQSFSRQNSPLILCENQGRVIRPPLNPNNREIKIMLGKC